MVCGEGGIRTPGTFDSTPDFESGTFDHSDTSPGVICLQTILKCNEWLCFRKSIYLLPPKEIEFPETNIAHVLRETDFLSSKRRNILSFRGCTINIKL